MSVDVCICIRVCACVFSMCACVCCVCLREQAKEGCVERVWVKKSVGTRLYGVLNALLRRLACEALQLL